MLDLIVFVGSFVAAFFAGRATYRSLTSKGWHKILGWLAGLSVAPIAMLGVVAFALLTGIIDESTAEAEGPAGVVATAPAEGMAPSAKIEPVDEKAIAATPAPTVTPTPRPTPKATPKPTPKATPKPTPVDRWAKKREEIERGPDFGISHAQFVRRFNQRMADMDMGLRLSIKASKSAAAQRSFHGALSDRMGVTGTMKISNDMLTSASLIGQGDGTEASGAVIMLGAAILFSAATANGTPDESMGIVLELSQRAQKADGPVKLREGDVTYSFGVFDSLGAMFTIEPH